MVTKADFIVVVVCLFTGYFGVSWFVSRFKRQTAHHAAGPPPGSAQSQKADDGGGNDGPKSRSTGTQNSPQAKPWYEVLGVAPYASFDEVKRAYRHRISEYHPDKTSGLGKELRVLAEVKTKDINAAYEAATQRFRT